MLEPIASTAVSTTDQSKTDEQSVIAGQLCSGKRKATRCGKRQILTYLVNNKVFPGQSVYIHITTNGKSCLGTERMTGCVPRQADIYIVLAPHPQSPNQGKVPFGEGQVSRTSCTFMLSHAPPVQIPGAWGRLGGSEPTDRLAPDPELAAYGFLPGVDSTATSP